MNQYYNIETKEITSDKKHLMIKFLYHTIIGRGILKIITKPFVSQVFATLTNSKISCLYIKHFIKKNHINMDDYEVVKYHSFNDFFTRHIKETARPISYQPKDLIAPCDAKLTAYKITANTELNIKNSTYTIPSLIQDENLAKEYSDGICLVFRLCVDDYHRYIFIDDGEILTTTAIPGKLHTVNPIALASVKVFTENHRVISVLKTKNFSDVIYIEVGALNVGKIHNYNLNKFHKGEEKGYFSFGASTIILLFKKDQISINNIFFANTQKDIETIVKQGITIGKKIK